MNEIKGLLLLNYFNLLFKYFVKFHEVSAKISKACLSHIVNHNFELPVQMTPRLLVRIDPIYNFFSFLLALFKVNSH